MLRARLGLGAALLGFLILLTELGFGVYAIVWRHLLAQALMRSGLSVAVSTDSAIDKYLLDSLLACAGISAGIVLYRAIQGRSSWTWNVAALSPVISIIVIGLPPVSHSQITGRGTLTLSWMAPKCGVTGELPSPSGFGSLCMWRLLPSPWVWFWRCPAGAQEGRP
jgi:hypothetical protein